VLFYSASRAGKQDPWLMYCEIICMSTPALMNGHIYVFTRSAKACQDYVSAFVIACCGPSVHRRALASFRIAIPLKRTGVASVTSVVLYDEVLFAGILFNLLEARACVNMCESKLKRHRVASVTCIAHCIVSHPLRNHRRCISHFRCPVWRNVACRNFM